MEARMHSAALQGMGWTRHGSREVGAGAHDGRAPGDSSVCPETQQGQPVSPVSWDRHGQRCWGQMSARPAASCVL